jgi:hypothetical protein
MSSAQEYRQFAEECVDWAKKAATDAERETFLKMAEDWLRAAAIAAQRDAPVPASAEFAKLSRTSIVTQLREKHGSEVLGEGSKASK